MHVIFALDGFPFAPLLQPCKPDVAKDHAREQTGCAVQAEGQRDRQQNRRRQRQAALAEQPCQPVEELPQQIEHKIRQMHHQREHHCQLRVQRLG